jgi:hypothetical protein
LENALKEYGVVVKYHELGSARLEHLLSAKDSFIEVTDEVDFPGLIGIRESGDKWKAAVSSVGGAWILDLFEKYGEKLYSANYRGFLGIYRSRGVNAGIRDTIEKIPQDFWAYNNGITILTKSIQETDSGKITLKGVSVINGAQTTGTIGHCEGKADPSKVSLLCRIIESDDEETIKRIVRYNNTQNAITSWDQYANDEQQKRLDSEFAELGFAYGRKRGFAAAGEQVTIDSVYQPVLAFHGKSRDAVRGKNQLFENAALYENAFAKTKARHILFAYTLSRTIDRIRLRLKAEEAEKGALIKLDDKQLRLLRNLNFKPFLIDVVARLMESICGKKMDVTMMAFRPEVAKRSLVDLEELWLPVVEAILPVLSIRVEPETFFRQHSDAGDAFITQAADEVAALLSSGGTLAKLNPFCSYVADS